MKAPMEVELLTADKFVVYWPMIEKELDRVPHIWDTWWTKDTLYDAATHGRFQVWAVGPEDQVRLVLFTQVAWYPANRILQSVCMLGNSFDECAPVLEAALTRYAIAHECAFMEVTGRPGLERALAPYGMRRCGVVLSKPVAIHGVH